MSAAATDSWREGDNPAHDAQARAAVGRSGGDRRHAGRCRAGAGRATRPRGLPARWSAPAVLGPGPHLGRRPARHDGHAAARPAPASCRWSSRSTASATPSTSTSNPASRPPTPTTPSPGRGRGYAVLTYTARGLWGSCGTPQSRLANAAACARGYIHLADVRYEVRDTQTLIGRLVDEGVADRAADRRHRRLLRRRAVASCSRRCATGSMLPDGRLVALAQPRRASRCGSRRPRRSSPGPT